MTVLLDTISAKLVSHVAHSRPIFVNCSISSTSCKSILWSILCLFLFFAWGHRYCIIACSLLKFETTFCFVFLSCSATSCDIVRFSEFLVKIFTIKSLALSIYLSRKGWFFSVVLHAQNNRKCRVHYSFILIPFSRRSFRKVYYVLAWWIKFDKTWT